MDSAYSLMHGLLGHDVMNLYDKKEGKRMILGIGVDSIEISVL